MALIKCSECGKEISDKAAACVHCGCPITKAKHSIRKGTMMCTSCKSVFYEIHEQCPKCGSSNKVTANPGENLPKDIGAQSYSNPYGPKYSKKPKTTPLTMGCAIIFVFLMVMMVIGLMRNGGSGDSTKPKKSRQVAKWYEGGTLHRATVSEWNKASYSNKLATAADWVVNISPRIKAKVQGSGSMDALRSYAAELVICVNEAAGGQGYGNVSVGELAATCGVIMGWTR